MKRYGLCCISNRLDEKGISFRSINQKQFWALSADKRHARVDEVLIHNLKVNLITMKLCHKRGWVYRMSSSLYPLLNLEAAKRSWVDISDEAKGILKQTSDYLDKTSLRVSLHPDQFVVPASAKEDVAARSIDELNNHSTFMNLIGRPATHEYPINIHMNCYKGEELQVVADRFLRRFNLLRKDTQARLVLENEDKLNSWNVQQLYQYIHRRTNIPITYDCLHFRCNPGGLPATDAVDLCVKTWGKTRPLFHYSDRDYDSSNIRAHADYPVGIPVELYNLDNVDLDVEFKMKDQAIHKIVSLWPQVLAYERV